MHDINVFPFLIGQRRLSGQLESGITPGQRFYSQGGVYELHKFKVAVTNGYVGMRYQSADTKLIVLKTASAPATQVCGVVQADLTASGAIPAGGYGYVQISGYGRVALKVTGTVNAQALLIASGALGEAVASNTTGDIPKAFAIALQAKSGTVVKAGEYIIRGQN